MLADLPQVRRDLDWVAVKEAVFPFARFPGSDPALSPEMKSTGEVMGIDASFAVAYAKSQLGEGTKLPESGTLFVSVKDGDKPQILESVRQLLDRGFRVIATGGTQAYLAEQGLAVERVNKVVDGEIALVFNTTEGWQSHKDSQSIRASALQMKVPYYTTAAASVAVTQAILSVKSSDLAVRSLQDYYS